MIAIISYLLQKFMEYVFSNFRAQFTAKFLSCYIIISHEYNFVPGQIIRLIFLPLKNEE